MNFIPLHTFAYTQDLENVQSKGNIPQERASFHHYVFSNPYKSRNVITKEDYKAQAEESA